VRRVEGFAQIDPLNELGANLTQGSEATRVMDGFVLHQYGALINFLERCWCGCGAIVALL